MVRSLPLALGACLMWTSGVSAAAGLVPQWERIRPATPTGRYVGAQIYDPIRDRLIVFGGFDGGRVLDELWQMSFTGDHVWQEMSPAGERPAARYLHSAVYDSVEDRMIMTGGVVLGTVVDEVWALGLSGTPTWQRLVTSGGGPGARFGQTLAYDAQTRELLAFGGADASGVMRNDLWRLSLETLEWGRIVPPLLSPGAQRHAGIWDTATSRFVLLGGDQGAGITGDAFTRPVDSQTFWQTTTPEGMPLPPRRDLASVYLPARRSLVCFGGEGPAPGEQDSTTWTVSVPTQFPAESFRVETLTFDTLVVDSVPIPPAVPRRRLGAAFIHDRALDRCVLYGGQIGAALTGEVWGLLMSPVPHWKQIEAHGINPLARKGHAIAYDPIGQRMVLFGGQGRTAQTWSFTLTDTMRGTWAQMSLVNPPATYGHTASYDARARRVIVFGGIQSGAPVNALWQLSLDGTPQWSPLSAGGPLPPARSHHVAIYDSAANRMLIQGGVDAAGRTLDDMWSLSLDAPPAWTRLWPPTVLPEGRNQYAAAFDPARRRLLIHGGLGAAPLDDLWAYDVDRDLGWTRADPLLRPSARYAHSMIHDTAVDLFVVFGGNGTSGNLPLNDVWQLHPATDTWLTSTPSSPPFPRANHSAVYDPGRWRMVVFGGDYYRPLSDVWQLSLLYVPPWNWTWTRLKMETVWPEPFGHREIVDDAANGNAILLNGSSASFAFPLGQPGAWVPFGVLNAIAHTGWTNPQVAVDPLSSRAYIFSGGVVWGHDEMSRLILGPAGSRIEPVSTSVRPQKRSNGRLIYDPVRHRMILFGGGEQGVSGWLDGLSSEVWTLSLGGTPEWAPLAVEGTPPSPRTGLTGIYDPMRDRIVYFGGHDSADSLKQDTWALELAGVPVWRRLEILGPLPPHRASSNAAYDPANDRMLVFGGVGYGTYMNDLWALEFQPTPRWRSYAVIPPWPEGRLGYSEVYIESTGEWVITGGVNSAEVFADLWVLSWTAATPALFSLVTREVTAEEVVLVWHVVETVDPVRLERHGGDEAWASIASRVPDGDHRVRFSDRDVSPGGTYWYRLVTESDGRIDRSSTIAVTIPNPAAFALEGAIPNPARRGATVRFSLPDAQPAHLELIDIAGRRLMRREVGALGPGVHTVELRGDLDLAPSVYILRLESAGRTAVRRVVIVD
jgi:hypothetical protein